MDPDKCVTRVDHLWIPGTLCITHVDSNNRISGEKLDANGTRSVFLGYRGRKNKLVWLLNGGRFITSPHVVAYESVNDGVGWAADPYDCNPPLPSQQILSVEGGRGISDRWLFDTGADVDATNKRQSFKPGTEVELRPSQFPIRTGNGIIHAESIGEIWLPLTGPGGKETVMRLKYVVYVKTFPLYQC